MEQCDKFLLNKLQSMAQKHAIVAFNLFGNYNKKNILKYTN